MRMSGREACAYLVIAVLAGLLVWLGPGRVIPGWVGTLIVTALVIRPKGGRRRR